LAQCKGSPTAWSGFPPMHRDGALMIVGVMHPSAGHLRKDVSMIKRTVMSVTLLTLFALSAMNVASAQGTSSPATRALPRPDFHFQGQVGRTFQDSDPPRSRSVRPPKRAPNILLILLDDVGFGQFSVFGGGVPSPNMEKLAAEGLRYNRFHTTAL
jgi:hypothetical protein